MELHSHSLIADNFPEIDCVDHEGRTGERKQERKARCNLQQLVDQFIAVIVVVVVLFQI